ncbi:MAG: hypothetical protein KDA59_20170, partial [Planctomycetales bacterium]|nr:hypothetical protein [Planctomycetales bacterium]
MPIRCEFLGLERPALESAADYLLGQFADGGAADLRDVQVVLPSGRAGRRLLEILVDRCESQRRVLTQPNITTVGRFPELLYQAKQPFADDLVQQLTWAKVLKEFDRGRLRTVVAQPPDDDDDARWRELGRLLQSLHRELASDALDFADVVSRGRNLEGFTET